MQTMKEYLTEKGMTPPKGMVYSKCFEESGLPLFTSCEKCGEEKILLLKAYIDEQGKTYCPACVREMQPGIERDPQVEAAIKYILEDSRPRKMKAYPGF